MRLQLASDYFANGQVEVALDEVKRSIAGKGDLPEAYNLRALLYAALGEDRVARLREEYQDES